MLDFDLEEQKRSLQSALMRDLQATFGNSLSNEMNLADPLGDSDGIPLFLKKDLDLSNSSQSALKDVVNKHEAGTKALLAHFERIKAEFREIQALSGYVHSL